jgi:predicted dehydrogenase
MRVGILGCGHVSRQYFEGVTRYAGHEVVACADVDAAAAALAAERHGVERALRPDELLSDPAVELVVNLTPPAQHFAETRRALQAGKHVYSEKPLALSPDEGRELVSLADRLGLALGCAPDTFLGPAIQTARRALDDGSIGAVVAGVAFVSEHGYEHFHPNVESFYRPGGGPLLDVGPYYATALVNCLGPVRSAVAAAKTHFPERVIGVGPRTGERLSVEVPTHVTGALEFESGALVTLLASWDIWSTHLPFIELYGETGSLSLPNPDLFAGPVMLRSAGPEELEQPPPDPGALPWEELPPVSAAGTCRGAGLADLAAAREEGREPRASGRLALHVLGVLEAVERAARCGERVFVGDTCERPAAITSAERGLPAGFPTD